jgi:hypothetical protein
VSAAAPRSPLFGNVTRHAFFSNGGRGLLFGVLASGDLPHIVDYVLLFTFPSASSLSLGYVRGKLKKTSPTKTLKLIPIFHHVLPAT